MTYQLDAEPLSKPMMTLPEGKTYAEFNSISPQYVQLYELVSIILMTYPVISKHFRYFFQCLQIQVEETPGGGGVLPIWWVIHMCRGFDPLFWPSGYQARSFYLFGVFFLIHQHKNDFLGTNPHKIRSFWPQNTIFPSIFLGPIFSGPRHTPSNFQAEYPPPPPPPPPREETYFFHEAIVIFTLRDWTCKQKYNWKMFIFCPFLLLFHLFIHFQTFSYFFQFLPFQVGETWVSIIP